jgi:hypothetical protein
MSAVTGEFEEIAPATCVSAILSNLTTPNTPLQAISGDSLMSRIELKDIWKVSISPYRSMLFLSIANVFIQTSCITRSTAALLTSNISRIALTKLPS